MNVLDIFSGIGAFSLGLNRAGMRTVAFCETDEYCRRVLAKHWPEVPCYDDVRTLTAARLAADGIIAPVANAGCEHGHGGQELRTRNGIADRPGSAHGQQALGAVKCSSPYGVDVICGGFPCQDISVAGRGAGIGGERSGLWREFARLIGELRPRYALVENVAALLARGMGDVLGDLAALGYDAEWHVISAADMGAPHRRERVWIVAHDAERGWRGGPAAHAGGGGEVWRAQGAARGCGGDVADAIGTGLEGCAGLAGYAAAECAAAERGGALSDAGGLAPARYRRGVGAAGERDRRGAIAGLGRAFAWPAGGLDGPWGAGWEDGTPRVATGVPHRVARLRALGNSLVPQIPEMLGRAIMAANS